MRHMRFSHLSDQPNTRTTPPKHLIKTPQLNSTPSPPVPVIKRDKSTDTKTINKGLSIPGRPFSVSNPDHKENHYETFQPSIRSAMYMLQKVYDGNQKINPESIAVLRLHLRPS